MKIIESWLREWVNPHLSIEQIAEQLTMAGLEVAKVERIALDFSNVVVGEILEVKPHPDAERLTLCEVRIGGGDKEALSIVCGASNVRRGLKVAVALVGARLPGNVEIKKAKLRGIESNGMMCSAKELGLQDEKKGLLELNDDAPLGEDVRQYLNLDDSVLEIELTANRGDCLSVLGVAREVAAINNLPLFKFHQLEKALKEDVDLKACEMPLTLKLAAKDACPRYVGCLIQGVNNQAVTPLWIRERLERSGLRAINPIVDVTNYVMLELGQPLHAFAFEKLNGGINVRYAKPKEKIILLDGKELSLSPNDLVIADKKKALALAGIMGGLDSGIDINTKDIFLESAYFDAERIRITAERYGLKTDAAYRFERGVDYNLQQLAIRRARQLLLEIVGGNAFCTIEQNLPAHLPKRKAITLKLEHLNKVLGVAISHDEVVDIFRRLAMELKGSNHKKAKQAKALKVIAPSYRFDLNIAEDLIEEVARIYGYGKLPIEPIYGEFLIKDKHEREKPSDREIKNLLVSLGYCEAITYSFVSSKLQKLLDPNCLPQKVINPISEELGVMRTSLLPGLVNALQYNLNRRQSRVRLFELGLCFRQAADELKQQSMVAGLITGEALVDNWANKQPADFYDVKNDVVFLLEAFGCKDEKINFCSVEKGQYQILHPGRSAAIYLEQNLIGHVGELHPKIRMQLAIKLPVYVFELDLQALPKKIFAQFKAISRFPAIERDLAFIVDKKVSWQQIKDKIQENGAKLLQRVKIFDVFYNEEIGKEKKSIAVRLTFQHLERTLVEEEVNVIVKNIVEKLEREVNIILRG